jgi:hypothetical protein
VEETRTSAQRVATITKGEYKFEFPVKIPQYPPAENIWYLSLCKERHCRNMTKDADIIGLTFPIPGFTAGESSPYRTRPTA